jgi:hypothetical protein
MLAMFRRPNDSPTYMQTPCHIGRKRNFPGFQAVEKNQQKIEQKD